MANPNKKMTDGSVMGMLDKALPDGALEGSGDVQIDNSDLSLQAPPSHVDSAPKPESKPDVTPDITGDAPAPDAQPVAAASPPEASVDDPWKDAEEFEVEDTDFNRKFKVRVPKTDAEWAKKGYSMHSDYTRKTQSVAKYRDDLDTLARSGGLDTAMSIIKRGDISPRFRNAMLELYYQDLTADPNTQLHYGQQAAQQQQYQQPTQVQGQPDENDPLGIRPVIDAALKPYVDQVGNVVSVQQQQRQAQDFNQRVQGASVQGQNQTYAEFASRFPSEFSGDRMKDEPKMIAVWNYANNAGILGRMGAIADQYRLSQMDYNQALAYALDCASRLPAAMYAAKLEMDRAAWAVSQTPTPSAAMSAADAAQAAERASRDALARTISAGSAAAPVPVPQPKAKVALRDTRGRSRSALDVLSDALQPQKETA